MMPCRTFLKREKFVMKDRLVVAKRARDRRGWGGTQERGRCGYKKAA